MLYLQAKFREIRYQVDYFVARFKQRYYSNNRDPRVIQVKLGDGPLISLRTFPHDKYAIKVGEFLTLSRKDRKASEVAGNQLLELDAESHLYSSSSCEDFKLKTDIEPKRARIKRNRSAAMNLPSPIFEIDSPQANMIELPKDPPILIPQARNDRFSALSLEPLIPKKLTKSSSIISRISSAGSNKSIMTTPEVWKTVLNDVSLQAARITFGTKSNTDQKGDITSENGNKACVENDDPDMKLDPENEDIFSSTYQEAKSKYMCQEAIISLYDYPHETISNFPCQISRGSLF